MREVEIGGRAVALSGAAYTAVAYGEEFGGDVWDALVALEAKGRVPVLEVLRCAWALAKTADVAEGRQSTPKFAAWCASLGQVNAADLRRDVHEELADGVLFRPPQRRGAGGGRKAQAAKAERGA